MRFFEVIGREWPDLWMAFMSWCLCSSNKTQSGIIWSGDSFDCSQSQISLSLNLNLYKYELKSPCPERYWVTMKFGFKCLLESVVDCRKKLFSLRSFSCNPHILPLVCSHCSEMSFCKREWKQVIDRLIHVQFSRFFYQYVRPFVAFNSYMWFYLLKMKNDSHFKWFNNTFDIIDNRVRVK